MVKINRELIEKVAQLSNLRLTEEETSKFETDFKEILDAFKILDEINVSKVESSFRPFEERNHLREDKIEPSLEKALKNVKNKQEHFFKAPRTIE